MLCQCRTPTRYEHTCHEVRHVSNTSVPLNFLMGHVRDTYRTLVDTTGVYFKNYKVINPKLWNLNRLIIIFRMWRVKLILINRRTIYKYPYSLVMMEMEMMKRFWKITIRVAPGMGHLGSPYSRASNFFQFLFVYIYIYVYLIVIKTLLRCSN